MPLLVLELYTQRDPAPETWPNMIPIELPAAQPGSAMISLTIGVRSGVVSSSCVFTEEAGCQVTAAVVAVRELTSLLEHEPPPGVRVPDFALRAPAPYSVLVTEERWSKTGKQDETIATRHSNLDRQWLSSLMPLLL